MNIGCNLKKYRKKNNFTQEYVANILNISRQAISAWENNQSYSDIDTLLILSQLYDVSLDYLFGISSEDEFKDPIPMISSHKETEPLISKKAISSIKIYIWIISIFEVCHLLFHIYLFIHQNAL